MEFIKNSHCSYCGSRFTEQEKWPRKCFVCYNDSYSNPLPVVVAMIPILDWSVAQLPRQSGVLIIQRSIEPKKGTWALPGGYMDNGETWQQACAREVMEEVGLKTDPKDYSLFDVTTAPSNGNLLIFANHTRLLKMEDVNFIENSEVSDIDIVMDSIELGFPTHTVILERYLRMQG